ncbi:Fic family protein [soil metagenome]
MKPPYTITPEIIKLVASISEKTGRIKAAHLQKSPTELRKKNRIKTIQSSLAIEGNTLSLDQVTAILENKRILAPAKDILEVKNAIQVYNKLLSFSPFSLTDICKAHRLLMSGLIPDAGKLRTQNVGIAKGKKVTHIGPKPVMIKGLMKDLLEYIKNDNELMLIKSCVFHYEFEFIHPFMDGNGRMGRLWQTILLTNYSKVFEFLPVESIIKEKQKYYYLALSSSDKQGNSTPFIVFMLEVIDEALKVILSSQNISIPPNMRIEIFKEYIGKESFTRQVYLNYFKEVSTATASRDLKQAVDNKLLSKRGDKSLTTYLFKK